MSLQPTVEAPAGKNVYYDPVKLVVNDWWVVAGNRNIEMRDILGARIVKLCYRVDWRKHMWERARSLLVLITFLGIIDLVRHREVRWGFWWAAFIYVVARGLWDLRKRAVEHALVLTTSLGNVVIARSDNEWYVQNIAREIGRRLAKIADDALVNAVAEPARGTLLIATEPPSSNTPITYKSAGVTIEADKVTIGGRVFPVEDILRAEVRKEVKPMSIVPWVGAGAWIGVYVAAIFVPVLWLLVVPMLLFEFFRLGIFGMLYRGVQEWQRTHKYTVVIETRYEDIELRPTAHVLDPGGMAVIINRIVKEHMLRTDETSLQINQVGNRGF